MSRFVLLSILLLAPGFGAGRTAAASASVSASENPAARASAFDPKAAVDAYLAKMPPAQRAHSDAYFEVELAALWALSTLALCGDEGPQQDIMLDIGAAYHKHHIICRHT